MTTKNSNTATTGAGWANHVTDPSSARPFLLATRQTLYGATNDPHFTTSTLVQTLYTCHTGT